MHRMKALAVALLLAGGFVFASSSTFAQQPDPELSNPPSPTQQKRIALVVGNSNYVKAPIPTAANDAGLIAQTLQAAGFDVAGARDLDGDTLRGSFRDFIQKAEASGPDTVAVVYLAGYGVQFAGENYFIPVDSRIGRDTDIPVEGLRISDYMRELAALPLQASIIVLDAARQQPFIENVQIASGLGLVEPDQHMLVAFNAMPGTVAPAEGGDYGAYAQALAEMIRAGGLPLPDLFDRVRLRVDEMTKGALVPWDAQKIDTPLLFFDRAPDAPPAPAPEQADAMRIKPIRDLSAQDAYAATLDRDTLQGYEDFLATYPGDPMAKRVRIIVAARREAITWRRTYGTDTPDAYWSYLRRYPDGPHAQDCRRRLAILSAAIEPPSAFAMIDYEVPPPPPDEVAYVDRPVLMFSDPAFDVAPPPPVPAYLLPPPPDDFVDLPPPLPVEGLYVLPQPIFVPIPVFVRPPRYIATPPNNIIFANIHNRVVIENEINRPRPPQLSRIPGGPAGQIFAPGQKGPAGGMGPRPVAAQFGAGPMLPAAALRRSALIGEGKLPRPASSFIDARVGQPDNFDRHAPLPGPRKFSGVSAPTMPASQAVPNRNALPVPGQAGVPNPAAFPGPLPEARGAPPPGGTNPVVTGAPSAGPPGPLAPAAGGKPEFQNRPGQPTGGSRQSQARGRPALPQIQRRPPAPQFQRPAQPMPSVTSQTLPGPRPAFPPEPRVNAPQRPAPVMRPAPAAQARVAVPSRPLAPARLPPRPAPVRPGPYKCLPNSPKC